VRVDEPDGSSSRVNGGYKEGETAPQHELTRAQEGAKRMGLTLAGWGGGGGVCGGGRSSLKQDYSSTTTSEGKQKGSSDLTDTNEARNECKKRLNFGKNRRQIVTGSKRMVPGWPD